MPLWACWPHQSISSKGLQSQLNVGTNATFLNVFGGTNHAMIGATSHFTQMSIQETLTPSSHVELMQKSEMNLFHDMISILFCGYMWVCIYIYTTSKLFFLCHVPPRCWLVLQKLGSLHRQIATMVLQGLMKCRHVAPHFEQRADTSSSWLWDQPQI